MSFNNENFYRTLRLLEELGENFDDRKTLQGLCIREFLKLATAHTDRRLLKSLMKLGVDLNLEDEDGRTMIMNWIDEERSDLIRILIDLEVDLNKGTSKFDPPLHYAVMNNKAKSVAALLKAKEIDINKKGNISGYGPIHIATINGNKDMINLLSEYSVELNSCATTIHLHSNSNL